MDCTTLKKLSVSSNGKVTKKFPKIKETFCKYFLVQRKLFAFFTLWRKLCSHFVCVRLSAFHPRALRIGEYLMF